MDSRRIDFLNCYTLIAERESNQGRTMATIHEISDEIRTLPEPLQQEVADFIAYLKYRHGGDEIAAGESPLDFSRTEIKAFSGRDAVEMQRTMRDEW